MTRYLSKNNFLVVITLFLLISCQIHSQKLPDNFKKLLVKGGDFWITTFQKVADDSKPYVFYIEGDGRAFISKSKVSTNPTPIKKTLLKLAIMDSRHNVVYVARPCQYTPMELNPKCDSSYWTSKRFSKDSVNAINDVINKINSNNQKFSIVGYSGGGGIAILIAAKNNRTKDIITIAGNLDHLSFSNYHNVPPMVGSLNPIDYVDSIKNIPQLHLSGGKDNIVPVDIAKKYVQKANSIYVKQKIFPKISHHSGWDKVWDGIHILRYDDTNIFN